MQIFLLLFIIQGEFFVFCFALFVEQNLATGVWGAVFPPKCTKTKKA